MSTFDSPVNMTIGYFTRDIYQRYLKPKAKRQELIAVSWLFGLALVITGFFVSYKVKSINDIWGWITMGLMCGLLVPGILRFYWWRFNGEGFAVGTLSGLAAAIIQRLLVPELNEIFQFVLVLSCGLIGSIVGTYLKGPTDETILRKFYRITKPFGFWGPYRRELEPELAQQMETEHKHDILALPFVLFWQINMFLWPMLLIIKNWKGFAVSFALFCICMVGMYFIWYRNLPKDNATFGKQDE